MLAPPRTRCRRAARLVTGLSFAVVASATAAQPTDTVQWEWRGWGGLHMEWVHETPLDVALPVIRLDQVRLAGTLGARLEVDAAAFDTSGNLSGFDDGVELRRARIRLAGDVILGVPLRYKVEFGYVPNQFSVDNFYLAVPGLGVAGTLRFGDYRPAMGLDLLTSSWDITLMEPSAALQALGPKNSPGLQIGRPFLDDRATWTLGLYGSGGGSGEYGSLASNMTSGIGRITWLALDEGDASRSRLLHLGVSASRQRSGNGQVQFRARPESYLAPYAIDTGTIATDRATNVAGELLWIDGPLTVQIEALHAAVKPTGSGPLGFAGAYAMASWSLTGESRGYDRGTATLARVRPWRNFEFGPQGGWGAVEAALRYSYTDLNDDFVKGGRLSLLMAGIDWIFRPELQWMLNLGVGSVRGGASNGSLLVLQTRIGLNF